MLRINNAFAIEKGESMQQVFDRMRDAVLLLAARHPGKTVLLASHGCAIRNLLCWAHGWPIERLNDVNCHQLAVRALADNRAFSWDWKNCMCK